MTTTVTVLQPGALSTIQDVGRRGHQLSGVSVSGAMDQDALLLGNRLVGNSPGAAAIEVTLGGAEFRFDDAALVAITGGDLAPALDGLQMPGWSCVGVRVGGVVSLTGPQRGLRAYVCVAGGIATEPQLGSRSTHVGTHLGGMDGRALKAGDVLPIGERPLSVDIGQSVPLDLLGPYGRQEIEVRVIPGPQADAFSPKGMRTFFGSGFIVTDRSDRQGIRFDGPAIEAAGGRYDIVSDAVAVGSIQVPGDGKPIALMADRQTTGGYAKIGVVATVDLPLLAQAAPGAAVRFVETDVDTAQRLLRSRRRNLRDVPLLAAAGRGEGTFSVNGLDYPVRVGAFPAGEKAWSTEIMVADQLLDVHVQQLGPNETG